MGYEKSPLLREAGSEGEGIAKGVRVFNYKLIRERGASAQPVPEQE
jgi:hypothetical protein